MGVSQVNDWAETCFCAWVKALLPAGQGHLLVKVTWCGQWTMLGARALWQEASDCSLCSLPLCSKEKWTSLHAYVMLSEACTRNTAAEAPPAWPHRWPWCSQFKLTSHCCWGTTSLATQVTVMQPIQAHISLLLRHHQPGHTGDRDAANSSSHLTAIHFTVAPGRWPVTWGTRSKMAWLAARPAVILNWVFYSQVPLPVTDAVGV